VPDFGSVPYVKLYRYNPKHLCPKLNGYGDNGQRKVGFIGVDVLYAVRDVILVQCACPTTRHGYAVTLACALQRTVALTSQDNISCGLRKVIGSLRTTMTRVRVFL